MINIISAISALGMAVGTAALIIILSIYNGFDGLVKSMSSTADPDLKVVPSEGKFFVPRQCDLDAISGIRDVEIVGKVLEDNVFVVYGDRKTTALVKGVDELYRQHNPLAECMLEGDFSFMDGERMNAVIGCSLASSLQLNRRFIIGLEMFYPDPEARISTFNPMGSLNTVTVWPAGLFKNNSEYDEKLIIVDRSVMCELLGLEDEVSSLEVRLKEGTSEKRISAIKDEMSSLLGDSLRVLERKEQNPTLYRMLKNEKAGIYMIMLFIVLILGFSIMGSISMLMIDKSEDIFTMRAMGADRSMVRRVFTLEGWMITLLGMAAGLLAGIVFCLLQQHFGFIKMPGNSYIIDAYPVILEAADVILAAAGISIAGYFIALIPSSRLPEW